MAREYRRVVVHGVLGLAASPAAEAEAGEQPE
jgi:hypothetical protein